CARDRDPTYYYGTDSGYITYGLDSW
nr:immunoglobulin heavy chain junction region [Macaca mulatta]MOV40389.1 immunoglobulin heavy chain junction region [Macaca mulatta]MOV41695.1 immunoglobulin heavy chain junction region [Macaca mulatta]MOV42311.1 immunoglobulin heavy chain junction region [Macaca mulatta]MOV45055.1 immunoglobulin heavy chain junction region [Macaca mulatta]